MKYFVLAGEPSGDLHGSNLVRALKKQDPNAEVHAWGGELMQAAGAKVHKHYRELAFMGFWEVLKNLRTIFSLLRACKTFIAELKPDKVILIDYPGFNIRMAKFTHQLGIATYYYISPQVWAWKSKRVHKIMPLVKRMIAILPFEAEFYKRMGYDIDYVGHPLLDVIEKPSAMLKVAPSDQKKVAVLPGSRVMEVRKMLPVMMEVAQLRPDYQFVIAKAAHLPLSMFDQVLHLPNVEVTDQGTYVTLKTSHAALVTSGTATLETALHFVPLVVCYRSTQFSYQIAKRLIRVPYISLVNLILNRPAVKELIQSELTGVRLSEELDRLFEEGTRNQLNTEFENLHNLLGGGGASARAAELVLKS